MAAVGDRDRGLDLNLLGAHVARGLIGQERHQLVDELAEDGGRSLLVSQDGELVVNERVVSNVQVQAYGVGIAHRRPEGAEPARTGMRG